MARDTTTSANYVEVAVSLTPTNPLSFACRYINNNGSQNDVAVLGIFDSSSINNRTFVTQHSGGAGANVRVLTAGSTGTQHNGYAAGVASTTAFNSVVVRLDDPGTRRCRMTLNGDIAGQYSGQLANTHPTTSDRFTLGYLRDNTPSNWGDVTGADLAVWTVSLDDDEVSAYHSGASPLLIRPGSLYCYAPGNGEVLDHFGRTVSNTSTTQADSPHTKKRLGRRTYFIPAAAPGGTIPIFHHHYNQMRVA